MKKQYKKLAGMGKYTTKFHKDNSQDIKLEATSEIADFIMNTIILISVTFLSAIKLYKIPNNIPFNNANTWILILMITFIITYIMLKIIYFIVKYFNHSARFKNFTSMMDGNYKFSLLKMLVMIITIAFVFCIVVVICFPYINTMMFTLLVLLIVSLSILYLPYYFPGLFFKEPKSKNNKKWKHHKI